MASQSTGLTTHAATRLASELNVARAEVSLPLGDVSSTSPIAPVTGSATFRDIDAALVIPSAEPLMTPSWRNWAMA